MASSVPTWGPLHTGNKCLLQDLPPQLLQMIYAECFGGIWRREMRTNPWGKDPEIDLTVRLPAPMPWEQKRVPTPLFLVNKNISRAARELFYTMKSFTIQLRTGTKDTWENQTIPALRQIGSFNLSLIQRLSFSETILRQAGNRTTIEECVSQLLFKEFPEFRPRYFELELFMQDFARTRFGKQGIWGGCECAEQWREQWEFRILFEEVDEQLSTREFRELSKVSLKKFSCYDQTAHEHVVPPQLAEVAARIHDQLGPSRPMRAFLMRFKQGWGNFNAPGECSPECDAGQDSLEAGCSLPLWEREMPLPEDWYLHMDNGIDLMFGNAVFDPKAKDPTRAPSGTRRIREDDGMDVYGEPS